MRSRRQNRQGARRSGPRRNSSGRGRDSLIEERRLSTSNPNKVMKFSRVTSQVIPITPATGWNGTAFDLQIAFSLTATLFYIAGTLYSTASNPGATDFVTLFDEYRLASVEVSMMYGANSVVPGTAATPQLPIMNIVFDPTDVSTISLSSILQYQNLRTVQLGNQRTDAGYVVKCSPRPLISAGSLATAMSPNVAPWLNKDVTNVAMFGLKIFYDNAGSTFVAVTGTVTFYVKYNWEMRNSQ